MVVKICIASCNHLLLNGSPEAPFRSSYHLIDESAHSVARSFGRSFEGSGSWVISTRWTSLCRWLTDWLTERVYGTRSECLPWAPRGIISHRALGDGLRVTRVVYRKGQQSGVERWQGPFVHQLLSNDVCSDGSLCCCSMAQQVFQGQRVVVCSTATRRDGRTDLCL